MPQRFNQVCSFVNTRATRSTNQPEFFGTGAAGVVEATGNGIRRSGIMGLKAVFLLLFFLGGAVVGDTVKLSLVSEWPGYPRWYGEVHGWHAEARDMIVAGNYAFALTDYTLSVLDVRSQEIVGFHHAVDGFIGSAGNHLYFINSSGLSRVDITDPSKPMYRFSGFSGRSGVSDIAAGDKYLYLLANQTLRIVEVLDATRAREVAQFAISQTGRSLAVSGDFLLITIEQGVEVVDVSDPENPKSVVTHPTTSPAQAIAIDGNYAFAAGNTLEVIDVTDPKNLATKSVTPLNDDAVSGIFVSDERVYVSSRSGNVHILGLSDPEAPVRLGNYTATAPVHAVAVAGERAYLAAGGSPGLEIAEVADPTQPMRLASFTLRGFTSDIAVDGNYARLADTSGGLRVLDISDPRRPTLIATHPPLPMRIFDRIEVQGDRAYLRLPPSGFLETMEFDIFDIADPAEPVRLGGYFTEGGSPDFDMRALGKHVYLSWISTHHVVNEFCHHFHDCSYYVTSEGYSIVDTTDVSSPKVIDPRSGALVYSELGSGSDFAISGNLAASASHDSFVFLDITNPAMPTVIGRIPGMPSKVAISGRYGYCFGFRPTDPEQPSIGTNVLSVIDIRDPSGPKALGERFVGGSAQSKMIVSGGYLYMGDHIFDVSDPFAPVRVGSSKTGPWVHLGAVAHPYAYVLSGGGVSIYRLDPQLSAQVVGSELRLRWPKRATGYVLQNTQSLSPTDWKDVEAVEQVVDADLEWSIPFNEDIGFFRMISGVSQ